jgi:hypothetical protein
MVVFFGLLGQFFQLPLDPIAAINVAVFIVRAGWGIMVSGMRVLLDASIDRRTLDTIRSTILRDPAVVDVKEILGRTSGGYVFIDDSNHEPGTGTPYQRTNRAGDHESRTERGSHRAPLRTLARRED